MITHEEHQGEAKKKNGRVQKKRWLQSALVVARALSSPYPPLVVVGTHLHIYTFFCANITTAAKTSEVIYLHLRVSTVRARGGGFCGMSDVIHQHTRGDKLHFHRE